MTAILWVASMFAVVSVLYIGAAGGYLHLGRPGMCVAFLGYVIANIGLIWDTIQMGEH